MKPAGALAAAVLFAAMTACSTAPAAMPADDAPTQLDTELVLQPTPPGLPVELIWEGRSGDYQVRWTTAEITARPVAQLGWVTFSAASYAARQVAASVDEMPGFVDSDHCSYEREFALRSATAPLLSLHERREDSCRSWAHPSQETRNTTFDLETARAVSLEDVFAAETVHQALQSHVAVQAKLARTGAAPGTLPELVAALADGEPLIPAGAGPCAYFAPEDLLTRFAFQSLEDRRVAVRLHLPADRGVCRGQFTELEIWLPVPPALERAFSATTEGREGFLPREAERSGAGQMSLRFDWPPNGTGADHRPDAEPRLETRFALHVLGRVIGRDGEHWILRDCGDDFDCAPPRGPEYLVDVVNPLAADLRLERRAWVGGEHGGQRGGRNVIRVTSEHGIEPKD